MKIISTQNAPAAIGPYSQAIVVNGFVFTSGQIALHPDGSFESGDVVAQTRQALTNLKNILEAAGSSVSNIVKTTLFLVNMDDFAAVNEVYEEFFGDHRPARSTVAVKSLPKDALVEIECVATIK